MAAQLSWHAQNCDLIGSLESNLEQNLLLQDFDYELITTYCCEMGWSFVEAGV